jgi:hypothetical protein
MNSKARRLALGTIALTLATALAPAAIASGPLKAQNVFGKRYCELLAVHTNPAGGYLADVYNTYGINTCPAKTWNAVDTTAVATQLGVLGVVRHGPRFWLMNTIKKFDSAGRTVTNLDGLRMARVATLNLPTLATAPFTVHAVDRATTFVWNAGATAYELRGPGGSRWVMQSYSRQLDPALRLADLATLAGKLQLPAGWHYRVVQLAKTLKVVTVKTDAQVLQDNLDDTYSRVS